jgi:hypothetical protein
MHDVADMYGGWHACLVLSDRLVKATNRMDEALLRMRSLIGSGKQEEFAAALGESESLRMECQAIRAELQRHRGQREGLPNAT